MSSKSTSASACTLCRQWRASRNEHRCVTDIHETSFVQCRCVFVRIARTHDASLMIEYAIENFVHRRDSRRSTGSSTYRLLTLHIICLLLHLCVCANVDDTINCAYVIVCTILSLSITSLLPRSSACVRIVWSIADRHDNDDCFSV